MAESQSLIVSTLAVLFGISSWIEVNGLWVELPLLISRLPERGYLASYIVVIAQIANLGPLLYAAIRKYCSSLCSDKFIIHVTMTIGTTSCILLIFFWSNSTVVGKQETSVSFLTLTFLLAFVDCTSSVLYLPYMRKFKQVYILPYFIGEGLSGVLPSIVSLAQGVGGNPQCIVKNNGTANETVEALYPPPRFSIEVFFIFLTGMLLVSWISFFLLNVLSVSRQEQVEENIDFASTSDTTTSFCSRSSYRVANLNISPTQSSTSVDQLVIKGNLDASTYRTLLILQGFLCCLTNGALPAVQTFSCLPYGNTAYHLAVNLSVISVPLGALIAVSYWSDDIKFIFGFSGIGVLAAAYIMSTAALSPTPPLVGRGSGEALLVLSWVVFQGVISYVKACIVSSFRQDGETNALFYCGVVTQIGSFIGAVVMFVIVNYTSLFVFYSPCTTTSGN